MSQVRVKNDSSSGSRNKLVLLSLNWRFICPFDFPSVISNQPENNLIPRIPVSENTWVILIFYHQATSDAHFLMGPYLHVVIHTVSIEDSSNVVTLHPLIWKELNCIHCLNKNLSAGFCYLLWHSSTVCLWNCQFTSLSLNSQNGKNWLFICLKGTLRSLCFVTYKRQFTPTIMISS